MNYRVYSVSFEDVTVSASQDLVEISPADDKPCAVIGWIESQNTELGDAAEEQLRCKWIRGHSTGGSGGSAATPRPLNPSDAAAGFAAEVNNTTIASVGTAVDLVADAWNVRAGQVVWLPPECWLWVTQGQTTLVRRLMAAPADALDMSATYFVAEAG